jgi:hypothetical protein
MLVSPSRFETMETPIALVLADSTGYGKLSSAEKNAAAGIIVDAANRVHVISPGSTLHAAGKHAGQHALTHMIAALAELPGTSPEDAVLHQLLHSHAAIEVIFIRAEDSVPASKKIQQRFKVMAEYRKDLSLPETDFSIMSLQEEFPGLHGEQDPLHFCTTLADAAFDLLIAKAISQVSQKYLLPPLVLVVCAGWNAEPNKKSSMFEALCAKHLSQCKTTDDLLNWALLNAGKGSATNLSESGNVTGLSKTLYQTYRQDDTKIADINTRALPKEFTRKFLDDDDCEEYIRKMLGKVALDHYKSLELGAHRADFFRYILLFFEGGVYLDMKSCLLRPLMDILEHCDGCSLVSCIGSNGKHIHQGQIMCSKYHPLLHGAMQQVMSTEPAMLSRRGKYLTFCNQMWEILLGQLREGRPYLKQFV